MNMRTQKEMFNFLRENLTSHVVELDGNKIKAMRLLKSRSFSSFKLTYLKNDKGVSLNVGRFTIRLTNDEEIFQSIRSFGFFKENNRLWEEFNYEIQS